MNAKRGNLGRTSETSLDPVQIGQAHEDAWRLLLATAFELTERADARLKKRANGLTLNEYEVLQVLDRAFNGELPLSAVSETVRLSRSAASRLVEKMKRAGFLSKQIYAENKRVVLVEITPAGRNAIKMAKPIYERAIQEQFATHIDLKQANDIAILLELVRGKKIR